MNKKPATLIIILFLVFTLYTPYGLSVCTNIASANLSERNKAEFSYEMAQISSKVVGFSGSNQEDFKKEVAYANALVTTRVMSLLPENQRVQFAYEMAQLTTGIINKPDINIEQSKASFSYEMARITAQMISAQGASVQIPVATNYAGGAKNKNQAANTYTSSTASSVNLATADRQISTTQYNIPQAAVSSGTQVTAASSDPNYISPQTYNTLIDELTYPTQPGRKEMTVFNKKFLGEKVNFDGEVRFHSMLNDSKNAVWDRNRFGIRFRLAADTHLYDGWRIHAMAEIRRNIRYYNNDFDLFNRIYLTGYLGEIYTTAGYFGYLMANGNIYDSRFKGVRFDYGKETDKLKYTVALGETNDTSDTALATVRYDDYDYSLEAGAYNYKLDVTNDTNTLITFGGLYRLNNYSLGALYLRSTLADAYGDKDGYVLSAYYGSLKTWRSGTYNLFAKYYDQPRYTYIAHGMEGMANWMHGFKGWSAGLNYTFKENLVGGVYYYNLEEKHTGVKGNTWWTQLSYYF